MDEQLKKYFQGELDIAERLKLLRQVEANDELKEKFIECKNMNALLSLSDQADDKKVNREKYIRFTSKIKTRKAQRILLNIAGYAAAIALLIISTYFITSNHYSSISSTIADNKLYVPAGQRVKLTLQDGTDVWLNSQTTFTYPAIFSGNERRVTVEGEAFFDVAKNAEKPFVVTSQGIEMKVLGTKFNVHSYPVEKDIQTSLIEGSLHVYIPHKNKEGVILKPNEQVTIKDGVMRVGMIPHHDYFLWRDGIYSFEDELLIDILKKLQLYYDVKIEIKDPSIFKWEYTGKFRQRDGIDEILRMIQRIHKFKIQKDEENNIITLSKQ
ncbi:FecR family protein [Parabacteroides sp.]